MKKICFLTILNCAIFMMQYSTAQQMESLVPATPANQRMQGFGHRKMLQEKSLLSNVMFENIGPSIMSGRVTDLDVNPADPTEFYVAYASGGLWHTVDNGISFTPLFDHEASMTIGDIAVNWNHGKAIWIGTGESNSSRSSYAGTGIYNSNDGGKTWQHKGLDESHHIGKIMLHPEDTNTLWVAVIGHLFSANKERGVYKTSDGGKTWKQVLFVDNNTGVIDIKIDPSSPNILYASAWHRQRRGWNFTEAGKSSGIYKTTDGGGTWLLITNGTSGFLSGEGTGRIGIAVFPGNPQIIYAVVDNQNRKEKEKPEEEKLTRDELRTMHPDTFLRIENDVLKEFLRSNGFPRKYSADTVKNLVRNGKIKPSSLTEYLEDANSLLFDTPVTGPEVYRSDNGGRTWKKTHEGFLDDMFYSYGYYFGKIWVSPADADKIYFAGVTLLYSDDGGKNFKSIESPNMHGDFHAMWINPSKPSNVIVGNDGGLNITYNAGKSWIKANNPPVGQFYTVQVDMDKPFNVYGGLQDNGVWYGPSNYEANSDWHGEGKYPYQRLLGGDGMQVQVDTRDNTIVYAGYQFGNYFRVNRNTGQRTFIAPRHELGERPYRFNWQSPILLSKFNQDILYFGSQKLHRSMNKGETWEIISGDLTKGGKKGDVAYGTLTTISESSLRFGLIYTGSDDGMIHVTRDGGNEWKNISASLPKNFYISRVIASQHDTGTVYVSLNGRIWDNFTSNIFVSDNYGADWKRIGSDLPAEPVNVICEDPVNKNILYAGTDHGVYVSLDRGNTFMAMNYGLPAVAVHDMVVHSRDRKLVIGTHGRSIFKADIKHVQQLRDSVLNKKLYAFKTENIRWSSGWGKRGWQWGEYNEPNLKYAIYNNQFSICTTRIMSDDSLVLKTLTDTCERGINYITYDLTLDSTRTASFEKKLNEKTKDGEKPVKVKKAGNGKYYLPPGKYRAEFADAFGNKAEMVFEVEEEK